MLGLKEDTNLAELVLVKHPLGVIRMTRDKSGLEFRLRELKDGKESGETIQSGKVRWTTSAKE
jgi:hypothetical protein